MAEESKTEEKREEREDAEKREDASVHAKLDKLGAHLDSLHKRMDSYESRKDEDEEEEEEEEEREDSRRRDSGKRNDVEGYEEGGEFHPIRGSKGYSRSEAGEGRKSRKKKSRRDSDEDSEESDRKALKEEREENALKEKDSKKDSDKEEESRKDSQPPAWAQALTEKLSVIEKHISDTPSEDRAKFAEVWNKAERLAQLYCDSNGAPKWMPGESLHSYTCRVFEKYKSHSPGWKDVDLAKVTEPNAFANGITQIYNDAEAAATRPESVPSGELRKIVDRSSGREIIRWVARNDDACWRQFTNESFMVGKFHRPQQS